LGRDNVKKMIEVLKAHSFSVTYHSDIDKFSIQGSSKVDKISIQTILLKDEYFIWRPEVLDETDSLGNRLIQLFRNESNLPELVNQVVTDFFKHLSPTNLAEK